MFIKKMFKMNTVFVVAIIFFTTILVDIDTEAMTEKKLVNLEVYPIETQNLYELEEQSTHVIKAKVLQEYNNITTEYDGIGYTQRNVEIIEVLKGDLKSGDRITIAEPYFETVLNNEAVILADSNYAPAIIDQEYLLFLFEKCNDEKSIYYNTYVIVGLEKGKYLINTPQIMSQRNSNNILERTNTELNIGNKDGKEYKEFLKEVSNKYNIK